MSNSDHEDDPLLTTKEAAKYLRLSPATLATWRVRKTDGPAFVRIGGRIFYPISGLKAFKYQHTHRSTSEYAAVDLMPNDQKLIPGRIVRLKDVA